MENMGYLIAAYTVIWAVVFGYVIHLYRKQRSLRREINLLKESIDRSKMDEK